MNAEGAKPFDSVILAGGFGTRLRPLTDKVPKPMLKVAGVPVFVRAVRLLRESGFMHTAVTTMYLPEQVEKALPGEHGLRFFRESADSPLGSAGAVIALRARLADTFCVLSGDAVCDFDLAELKNAFVSGGCAAGIVLARVNDAGEYGTVCLEDGLVTGFCEKPSAKDTLSDLVNTGIYFFKRDSLAGFTGCVDFARDVFPALLARGERIAGFLPEGHWFDVGSFFDYHRCNMFFTGGENARGAHISLHPEANVCGCVIADGVTVGKSTVCGSIIGENAVIGNGCFVPPGCVIGGGAELRDCALLAPGTVVARDTAVFAAENAGFPG
ncbi:MAG: NDP-sugar synthase, partial [Clostridia bacterium]|nr:NDP-sugar synthase [Clostridia bacterium]